MRQQAIEIALEQTLAEPIGYAIGESCRCTGLIGTQNPTHALLAQVVGLIRFTQYRKFPAARQAIGFEFRRLVINDILVFDRNAGHIQAEHAAGLACIIARGAYHVLGDDVAVAGRQMPLSRGRALHRGDFGLLMDFRAAGACALAQRHGQIRRRDVAVVGMIEGADDFRRGGAVAKLDERPQIPHLLRSDHLEGHTDGVRRTAVLLVLIHAFAACGQPQIPGDMETDILAGF